MYYSTNDLIMRYSLSRLSRCNAAAEPLLPPFGGQADGNKKPLISPLVNSKPFWRTGESRRGRLIITYNIG